MPRAYRTVLVVLAMLATSACSATKVTTAWRAPAAQPVAYHKVLALAVSDDPALRRVAEDEICDEVEPVACEEAYAVIPSGETLKLDEAKARVKAAGFDCAVVFRVVGEREKVTYVPPTFGPTFWGFYNYAWGATYSPGYHRIDNLVRVETSVYSLSADQLVWVGTTETVNPKSVPDLVDEVVEAVSDDMRAHGLLPKDD